MKRDEYFYYTRTEEGKQYAIYCRKQGSLEAAEEDSARRQRHGRGAQVFPRRQLRRKPESPAAGLFGGFRRRRNVHHTRQGSDTGQLLADEIPNTYYSLEWGNDNATFFYTVLDAAKRPYKVYRHTLGVKKRIRWFIMKRMSAYTLELEKTRSRAYILINIGSSLTSEVRYVSADRPKGRFSVVLPRVQETEYDVTHHSGQDHDSFFIRTNDGAKTFRVMRLRSADPSRPNWKELLPQREASLSKASPRSKRLPGDRRARPRPRSRSGFRISPLARCTTSNSRSRSTPPASARTPNTDTKLLRFHYTSLVTPKSACSTTTWKRASASSRSSRKCWADTIPRNINPSAFYANAPDGVKVPISWSIKRVFKRNGRRRCCSTATAPTASAWIPTFSSDRLSLLDRGLVYAIAHIRGGGGSGQAVARRRPHAAQRRTPSPISSRAPNT